MSTAHTGIAPHVTTAPAAHSKLKQRLTTIWNSWATRSLAIGAVATGLDLVIGISLRQFFHVETRIAAMTGVIVGATFTYFANKYFAFREHNTKQTASIIKFILVTAVSSVVHGQVVVWLTDRFHVPFAVSKMLADLAIFTFAQLFVLRYIVFPKAKNAPVDAAAEK